MNHQNTLTPQYINQCCHPAIQQLRPQLRAGDLVWTKENQLMLIEGNTSEKVDRADLTWMPTLDQLLSLLREKSKNPKEPLLRPCQAGWECVVTIAEWAADYGTFVEARRRFVDKELRLATLNALKAAVGASERWMV